MNLEELTPREELLIRGNRRLRALWSSRHGGLAIGAAFAINTLAMAASSGMRGPELWIFSALQAVVVTVLCIAPGVIAYILGAVNRVDHRWAVVAALFIAVANIASMVGAGLAKT